MSSAEDKLIQYLGEAYATELALVSTLRGHIAVAPSGPYRSLLERHLVDTRRQAERLEDRLAELGVTRSLLATGVGAVQSLLGQVLSFTRAPIGLLRGSGSEERLLKDAKDGCATEALEIATYDALEHVAAELGDVLTAELARDHRAEEEAMLLALRVEIPSLAREAVAAEVFGLSAPTGEGDLPIDDYDSLNAREVVKRLGGLTENELERVAAYERGHASRKTVLARVDSLRGEQPQAG